MQIVNTPLTQINEPDNPSRININQEPMEDLIDSIKERGLLQPILLKRSGDHFEIEAGHRRFLALKQLGWDTAPSIILGDTDKDDLHIERAHENLIREDLSVIEEAKMVNALVNEKDRGIEGTAYLIKRSISWIESRLDLLSYQDEMVTALAENKITLAVAKELSKCRNSEYRLKLLEYVIDTGANSRVVARWVSDSTVEDFTAALEQSKATGIIQSIDLGPTLIQCGICIGHFSTEKLRHIWLCPVCIDGIFKIREEYIREAAQEQREREHVINETPG